MAYNEVIGTSTYFFRRKLPKSYKYCSSVLVLTGEVLQEVLHCMGLDYRGPSDPLVPLDQDQDHQLDTREPKKQQQR